MTGPSAYQAYSTRWPYRVKGKSLVTSPSFYRCRAWVAKWPLRCSPRPLAERNYHALRSYAGVAPITRQSGKKRLVVMRQSGHPRLRNAIYHGACVHAQHDERAKKHYAALRAKGHSPGRAIRGIADRLLAVLITMLRTKTLYDPAFPALPKPRPDLPANPAA